MVKNAVMCIRIHLIKILYQYCKTNLYMKTMGSCIQMDSMEALEYLSELKESGGWSPRPEMQEFEYPDGVEDTESIERLVEEFFNRSELQAGKLVKFGNSINC